MRRARVRLRIKRLKLDGLDFRRQFYRWNEAIAFLDNQIDGGSGSHRLISSKQFGEWAKANVRALTAIRDARHIGPY